MANIKKILAFIYSKEKDELLILKTNGNTPKKHGGYQWFTITGSVDQGETHEQAVRREVKEETGLGIESTYDLRWESMYKWQGKICEEVNYIAFVKNERVILNEEHGEYAWLPLKEFVKKVEWTSNKRELEGVLYVAINEKVHPLTYKKIDDFTGKNKFITKFINEGQVSLLSWHETGSFSKLKNIKQVSGVCFNDKGEILIIKTKEHWSLPGGTPEQGETFEQTLRREVDEEGDIDIESLIPIGYNKIEQIKDRKKETLYQLRYVAKIAKLKEQTIDPATGIIPQRRFIKPEEFLYYCPWGKPGEAMIKRAVQIKKVKIR